MPSGVIGGRSYTLDANGVRFSIDQDVGDHRNVGLYRFVAHKGNSTPACTVAFGAAAPIGALRNSSNDSLGTVIGQVAQSVFHRVGAGVLRKVVHE